ncbi:MAG: NAD-dependent epimerase/dehydratase family protein [Planctomycetota bacterium]
MIFITGATGFIGSKVVEYLLNQNEEICILSRRKLNFNDRLKIVYADITDIEQYKTQLKHAQILVHIAGCAKAFSEDISEFYKVNFLATKNLINRALEYGIKKIIYLSTCMIFGPSNRELSEDDFKERNIFFTDYEKSKYLAEKFVRKKIKQGAPIIILYPTRVFGPGKLTQGNSLTKLILFFSRFKYLPVIENPFYKGNYVYIDDVVKIIVKAIYCVNPPNTFLVGGYNLSFYEFVQGLNKVYNTDGKILIIKKKIACLLSKIFEQLEVEMGVPALISRGWVNTFATHWLFTNKKVKNFLNYEFVKFETALKNTKQWLENYVSNP